MRKYMLGKVFISHSSKDKPFVRRLTQRLWREGYTVWLDEKELVPGDALASRLSDALKEARVVVVVVTPSSRRSKWLAFELNKATERMVKGECRIIPVLAGRVALPAELEGVVYADYRSSPKKGMASLLAALEIETRLAVRGSWVELGTMIEDAFDSAGSTSKFGGYETWDYSFVILNRLTNPNQSGARGNGSIIYDTAHDYGHRAEPLNDDWWREYRNVQDRYGETFHLVVSERPVQISSLQPSSISNRVLFFVEGIGGRFPFCAVFADVSSIHESEEKRLAIQQAKEQIILLADQMEMYLDAEANTGVNTPTRRKLRRKPA